MIKKMKQKQNQSAGTQTKITINPEQVRICLKMKEILVCHDREAVQLKLA
jgi:hypothetical protein